MTGRERVLQKGCEVSDLNYRVQVRSCVGGLLFGREGWRLLAAVEGYM